MEQKRVVADAVGRLALYERLKDEHSVANMTIFSIALLGEHPDTVSLAGMWHNLLWVTLGNTISGTLFMAGAYWFVSGSSTAIRADGVSGEVLLVEAKN